MMSLVGHLGQQVAFAAAWTSGRMHHAWLLTGPRGIGKATFANAAAAHVLAGGAADRLGGSPGHPALGLLAAGSHPDFRRLERPEDEKGNLRKEILIEQMRDLLHMFHTRASQGGWRVVIVDAAEDLNRNAANAFLKLLEEPSDHTIFFLVSHSPSQLSATIRSRCRSLRFLPLGAAETTAVLCAELPDAAADEVAALARLAAGSPGQALRFAGLHFAHMSSELADLARGAGDALALARGFAGKAAQLRYEALVEFVPGFIAAAARDRTGASLARAIALWEKAHALAAEAVPLAYDPQAVAFELAGLVGELGKS